MVHRGQVTFHRNNFSFPNYTDCLNSIFQRSQKFYGGFLVQILTSDLKVIFWSQIFRVIFSCHILRPDLDIRLLWYSMTSDFGRFRPILRSHFEISKFGSKIGVTMGTYFDCWDQILRSHLRSYFMSYFTVIFWSHIMKSYNEVIFWGHIWGHILRSYFELRFFGHILNSYFQLIFCGHILRSYFEVLFWGHILGSNLAIECCSVIWCHMIIRLGLNFVTVSCQVISTVYQESLCDKYISFPFVSFLQSNR